MRAGKLGRACHGLAHGNPCAAGPRSVVESGVLQQQGVALGGVEGERGHRRSQAAGPGRVRAGKLRHVARAEALAQPQRRRQNAAAADQLILLLEPQNLWNVRRPNAKCNVMSNVRQPCLPFGAHEGDCTTNLLP